MPSPSSRVVRPRPGLARASVRRAPPRAPRERGRGLIRGERVPLPPEARAQPPLARAEIRARRPRPDPPEEILLVAPAHVHALARLPRRRAQPGAAGLRVRARESLLPDGGRSPRRDERGVVRFLPSASSSRPASEGRARTRGGARRRGAATHTPRRRIIAGRRRGGVVPEVRARARLHESSALGFLREPALAGEPRARARGFARVRLLPHRRRRVRARLRRVPVKVRPDRGRVAPGNLRRDALVHRARLLAGALGDGKLGLARLLAQGLVPDGGRERVRARAREVLRALQQVAVADVLRRPLVGFLEAPDGLVEGGRRRGGVDRRGLRADARRGVVHGAGRTRPGNRPRVLGGEVELR